MTTLHLSLSEATYERLRRRADRLGKEPEQVAKELVEASLGDEKAGPRASREIFEAAGLLVPLSDELRKMIIPGVTLEEVQAAYGSMPGPSLSDIVIEQRGPQE
jgi:hypothetical protein